MNNPIEKEQDIKQSEEVELDTNKTILDSTKSSVNSSNVIDSNKESSSADESKLHKLYASDQRGILNWNVAMFQYLVNPSSEIRNIIMETFLSATKLNYSKALFCDDKYQLLPTTETFDFVNNNKEKKMLKIEKNFTNRLTKFVV